MAKDPNYKPSVQAVFSAFTGICFGPFSEMHEYAEHILGRSVWTHQFADSDLVAELKEASKEDFIKALEMIKPMKLGDVVESVD